MEKSNARIQAEIEYKKVNNEIRQFETEGLSFKEIGKQYNSPIEYIDEYEFFVVQIPHIELSIKVYKDIEGEGIYLDYVAEYMDDDGEYVFEPFECF